MLIEIYRYIERGDIWNSFLIAFFVVIMFSPLSADTSRYGGILIFGSMGEPLTLDPATISDSESAQVANTVFETLVKYDSINERFLPLLATSWDVSSDYKVWRFYLRKGVKFHDGNSFNAGSVKFSWERQKDNSHPFHDVPYGRYIFYRSIWGGFPGNIKNIKIIDNYTVEVELYSKDYKFLSIISQLPFAIVSPHAVNRYRGDFYQRPVGTGPFRFLEWRPWQRIVLEGNKDYWGGRPYIDRLVFEPTPGEDSRRRQMERQRIDMMENPTTDFIYNIEVKNRYDYLKIEDTPGTNLSYIIFNCQKPPLDNPLLRKAINYAIDKDRIKRKDINEPPVMLAWSPFENIWGYDLSSSSYTVDHKKARELFAQAGYSRGFKIELWYPLISRPYLVSPQRTAMGIEQSFKEVGLQVNLKGLKWETYEEKLRYGEHICALTGYTGIDYDPDFYFMTQWDSTNAVMGGTNNSFYSSSQIHNLLGNARLTGDRSQRVKYYDNIQDILYKDSPFIPMFYYKTRVVMKKNIKGFSAEKNGLINFASIWIDD